MQGTCEEMYGSKGNQLLTKILQAHLLCLLRCKCGINLCCCALLSFYHLRDPFHFRFCFFPTASRIYGVISSFFQMELDDVIRIALAQRIFHFCPFASAPSKEAKC